MASSALDLLACHGISNTMGFLPDETPSRRLPDADYEPWEKIVDSLHSLLQQKLLRGSIEEMPIIGTSGLRSEPEWRRAYAVLSFLTQAYIWGGEQPSKRLPPQLTVPFLKVSQHLGLPPIATYSALNLWNYGFKSTEYDPSQPDNLYSLITLTGTKDEEWFYLISVALEARGSPIIKRLLACRDAIYRQDVKFIVSVLNSTQEDIIAMGTLLNRMEEHCDPEVFYHQIRPMLAGTKGMDASGLPNGVFYDEGQGKGEWRQYSGGSNAQSSLIQLLDIFLGVEHFATGCRDLESGPGPKRVQNRNGFLLEMRKYMPLSHRKFLHEVSEQSSIRTYVESEGVGAAVLQAYNETVSALAAFRDVHIRIVSRYIVIPSRSPNPFNTNCHRQRLNLATASSACMKMDSNPHRLTMLHGTGGTRLIPFLKQSRNETMDAVMKVGMVDSGYVSSA